MAEQGVVEGSSSEKFGILSDLIEKRFERIKSTFPDHALSKKIKKELQTILKHLEDIVSGILVYMQKTIIGV